MRMTQELDFLITIASLIGLQSDLNFQCAYKKFDVINEWINIWNGI